MTSHVWRAGFASRGVRLIPGFLLRRPLSWPRGYPGSSTPSSSPRPRTWFLDLSPIRDSPAYLRFWTSGVAGGIGTQLTAVAIGIQVYDLSGSTAAVASKCTTTSNWRARSAWNQWLARSVSGR